VGENQLVQCVQEETEHLYRMCVPICYKGYMRILFTYLKNLMVYSISQRANRIILTLKDPFLRMFTKQSSNYKGGSESMFTVTINQRQDFNTGS
jgi:hypothetical protein